MTHTEFIMQCPACGGAWTSMLLQGMRTTFPREFEKLPDVSYSFTAVSYITSYLCERDDDTFVPEAFVDTEMSCVIHPFVKDGIIQFALTPLTEEEQVMPVKELFKKYEGGQTDETY